MSLFKTLVVAAFCTLLPLKGFAEEPMSEPAASEPNEFNHEVDSAAKEPARNDRRMAQAGDEAGAPPASKKKAKKSSSKKSAKKSSSKKKDSAKKSKKKKKKSSNP